MIALRTIQASVTPNQHGLSTRITGRSRRILTFCSNKSDDNKTGPEEGKDPEGDATQQDRLARIAMLQTEKIRLTGFLDDKADYLTKFAEEAKTEFDQIAGDVLKELEESNAKKMEELDSQMQAFEESAELNRKEREQNDRILAEFEDQVERDKNQGLFFKSLGNTKEAEKDEIMKSEDVKGGSRTKRNVYLAGIGLLAIGIANAFIESPPDWKKVALLGAFLVVLIPLFANEQEMISQQTTKEAEKETEEDKQV